MKRIGILTAGEDTPALNATIHGAVTRANQLKIELYRFITAREAIFTRKVGHTQRGGRPILFDRFCAAELGAKSVEMLAEGRNNAIAILQYSSARGFYVEGYDANRFRDRWGLIHARHLQPAWYDAHLMKPSKLGLNYLAPIFTDAIGEGDMEHMRQPWFARGNLSPPYHSMNTDVHKRICFLPEEDAA